MGSALLRLTKAQHDNSSLFEWTHFNFVPIKIIFLVIPDMEPSCLVLTEEDVPGASLGKFPDGTPRTVNQLTVPELRRWLACRGARRKGNKAELVDR